jgi:hypothetical protein
MRVAPFSQPPSGTVSQNTGATWVVDRTAQMARVCLTPERPFLLRGGRKSRGALLILNRICPLSTRSLLYALLIALAFSMEPCRFVMTGARADESFEPVYPGRYAANCKAAPIVGCVCETDSAGRTRQLFQTAGESDDHDGRIGNIEYLRMMEWLRATCIAVTRPGGLR